jgi:hypothetical protein
MDFIERLFGIAPDGGNGFLELSLIATCVLGVAGLLTRRLRHEKPTGLPSQTTGSEEEVYGRPMRG